MMKKTALVMAVMFALSSFSFAGEGKSGKGHKKMDPEQKAKREAVKKEKMEYFNDLETLIEKYNNASDKNKDSVKKEITALVSTQTDKDIAAKKEKLAAQQKEISEIENDKTAYVNKKVDFLLSEKGQEKMQKMKEKKNKDEKDFKQHKGEKKHNK
ncbi:MAG: hypothetical protein FWH43_00905 [Endomicrobia bacterium]|nr:hypothetical protein [Endomicrobiia bacterium]